MVKNILILVPGNNPFCLAYPILSSLLSKLISVIAFLSNKPVLPIVKDNIEESTSSIDINLITYVSM